MDRSTGTTIAIVTLIASVGYIAYSRRRDEKKSYPPFAPGGVLKHIEACTSAEYPWFLLNAARQLNTRIFRLKLGTEVYAVGEPTTLRTILTDPLTTKPDLFYKTHEKVAGGPALNTTNGAVWHAKRKAVAPAFSSNHVKRMTKVALDKTEAWINEALLRRNNSSFDVAEEILGIVLSALTETAFEYEMSKEEMEFYTSEMKLALIEYDQKTATNPLRNLFGVLLLERRRADAAVQSMHQIVQRMMTEYRKKESTIDGSLIQLVMESDTFPTDKEKATELNNFLIAGHDTTGYSIAWILISLAKHPEEQLKLRIALCGMPRENWSNCEELQNVIKEGMRLHPVGASIRTIGREITTNKKNEVLPKGSICMLTFILLFRNPDVFDEPDSFSPSRWENPTREMIDAMQPFGLGRQNCVGQALAKAETFAIVARIISEFELTVEKGGTVDFFLTLKPVGTRLRARKV